MNTISEMFDGLGRKIPTLVIEEAAFSSLPHTITNSALTANHVCIKAELGTPSAQTSEWWTVTTSAGSATITGSISGSTTAKLYFTYKQ